MEKGINEVINVTGLSKPVVKQLLNYFKWDKDKLLEKLFEDDQKKLFKDAKIEISDEIVVNDEQQTTCQICFDEADVLKTSCGHSYCENCWQQFLTSKIIDDGVGDGLKCPDPTCKHFLDDKWILKTLKDPKTKKKYVLLISNKFVICHRLLSFCPRPSCTNVVQTELVKSTVKCNCGHLFCFNCSATIHEPVTCETVEKWQKLLITPTDNGTERWISKNCRPCPQCRIAIEKNGGCNHMFCGNCGK